MANAPEDEEWDCDNRHRHNQRYHPNRKKAKARTSEGHASESNGLVGVSRNNDLNVSCDAEDHARKEDEHFIGLVSLTIAVKELRSHGAHHY